MAEAGRAGQEEEGTQQAVNPFLEEVRCALVACEGVEAGSWGCSLEEGKLGWAGADWEEGKWMEVEDLEVEGLDEHRRVGDTPCRTKGAWARRRALRSSS